MGSIQKIAQMIHRRKPFLVLWKVFAGAFQIRCHKQARYCKAGTEPNRTMNVSYIRNSEAR